MTTIYVTMGGVAFCAFVVWLLMGKTASSAKHEQKVKYQEAEIELRQKMADVDAAPDVDDPLSML